MKNKILAGIAYTLWGIIALVTCVYLTFPTGEVKDIVTAQLESILGPEYSVNIDDLSLSGLSGVDLEGIQILPTYGLPPTQEEAGEETNGNEGAPVIALPTIIQSASANFSPFDYLFHRQWDGSFEIELDDAAIWGSFESDPEQLGGFVLDINLNRIDLLRVGLLSNVLGVPVRGVLTGRVPLRFRLVRFPDRIAFVPAGESDTIELQINDLVWGSGPIGDLFIEQDASLGQLNLDATVDGDEINITLNTVGGADMELEVTGRLSFPDTPGEELYIRLNIRAGFTQAWNLANGNLSDVINYAIPNACVEIPGELALAQCGITLDGPAGRLGARPLR